MAGKYKIDASHPDLKVELKGSSEVCSYYPLIDICMSFVMHPDMLHPEDPI